MNSRRKLRFDRLFTVVGIAALIITLPFRIKQTAADEDLMIMPTQVIYADEYIRPEEAEEIITYEPIFIGTYKLTGYCACSICCGDYADGITYTGTQATEGRTIAVDPNKIPLGSKVLINGNVYIAEDIGGAIKENRIDIYKDSHSACFSEDCNGYTEVYLLEG